ncbi:hypothetical protein SAMN04488057_101215 [Cyclobacterium lianum]|uniref:Uncharacterized protein n=1 Tax=Cyclobacterium lianum TaxID=388280 RepID=A0A1M7I7I7_9BACT|nr:hypothetical protein [Cyclobacterium lianum]SHM36407.1 hypothetical protein SAMN04488057_101215 [Cyclobacterium lianum]
MKKLFKPASLLFNLLCLLVFFLTGIFYAGWIGAGEGQGLAAGAIVLSWGVTFALVAFLGSFFLTYHLVHKKIIVVNWIFFALLLLAYGISHYRYVNRTKPEENKSIPIHSRPDSTTPTGDQTGVLTAFESAQPADRKRPAAPDHSLGMGYFSPNVSDSSILYFYHNPNLEKSMLEPTAQDSITFRKNEYNQFEIATAPPWLVPDIMKLDYDMLYFKIKSVSREWVEIIVNSGNGQSSFVYRQAGELVYWPEFLLNVNSVELLPDAGEKVKTRPLTTSGDIQTTYAFLRPVKIQGDWAEVVLLNQDFQEVGRGWIRWREEDHLLIRFNLLS